MENIGTIRQALAMSQKEFAFLINSNKGMIGNWESGARSLTSKLIYAILYLIDLFNYAISNAPCIDRSLSIENQKVLLNLLREKRRSLRTLEEKINKLTIKIEGYQNRMKISNCTIRKYDDSLLELSIDLMGSQASLLFQDSLKELTLAQMKKFGLEAEINFLEKTTNNSNYPIV